MLRYSGVLAALAITLAACGAPADTQATTTQEAPAPVAEVSQAPAAETVVSARTGNFDGRSDHITTGQVILSKVDGEYQLVFAADFSLDGAPDPVVGFGRDGEYIADSKVGVLKEITGGQSYSLPADFDASAYNEVYVWCDQFSVPLGVATLAADSGRGS